MKRTVNRVSFNIRITHLPSASVYKLVKELPK